jgi:hypothetical protein
LNSSVYRARADLIISFPFADCQLRDTFCRGKITPTNIQAASCNSQVPVVM